MMWESIIEKLTDRKLLEKLTTHDFDYYFFVINY